MENRHIGILQKAYEFCEKYNLSHDQNEPKDIMKNALSRLTLRNNLNKITEESGNHYVNVSVYYMDTFMVKGKFTPEQLTDLSNMGSVIKFES